MNHKTFTKDLIFLTKCQNFVKSDHTGFVTATFYRCGNGAQLRIP